MRILSTKRIHLEQVTLSDAEFVLELFNSPGWLRFIGDRNVRSIDDAQDYIRTRHFEMYADEGFGMYKMLLKSSGIPVGMCGLIKRDSLEHVDIGYAILPKYERQGYTYEAAQAVKDWAITDLQIDVLVAVIAEDNIASRRILEKIGLHFDRMIKFEEDEELACLYTTK